MFYIDRFTDPLESDVTDLGAIFNRKANLGTSPITPYLIETAAGYHDPIGVYRVPRQNAPLLTVEGELYGSDLSSDIEALTGDIGRQARLVRVMEDATEQWVSARLLNVDIDRNWPLKQALPVRLLFQATGPWNGTERTESDTYTSGDGYTIDAGGNVRQYDVLFRVNPIGTAMTSLVVSNYASGIDFEFTGTVNSGQTFEIDSGEMSVTNNGVDAYDDLSLESDHKLDGFFVLLPDSNVFSISFTGPATATVYLYFYEAWA